MAEFFHMGGYAAFIWPAFGIVAVVLLALMLVSRRTLKAQERTLAALEEAGLSRRSRRRKQRSQEQAPEEASS